MDLTITIPGPSDLDGLISLTRNLKETSTMRIKDPAELAKSLIRIQTRGIGKVLVLKDGNEIVGFADAVLKKKFVEIGIGLKDNYRGRDLGHLLLERLISELDYPEGMTLVARIKKENIQSIKLFTDFGFELDNKTGDYLVFKTSLGKARVTARVTDTFKYPLF